jgi:hypothetical protein
MNGYNTQNDLLLNKLLQFYSSKETLDRILPIINGSSQLSIRIIDWFVTNYAKKNFIVYPVVNQRFKVYTDYKLKLKAYSKKRFDPFCRWERINIPYDEDSCIQTTLGQLNFFKWALENKIIDYIRDNFEDIENDMNSRNTSSKKRETRKKREELSISAMKSIKREEVEIIVKFD